MLSRLLALGTLALLAHGQTRKQAEQAFDSGRYADAARLFEKDYQESSRCAALFGLGLSQYRLHKIDAALIAFQSSIQCDPKLTLAHIAIGEAYSERHNNKEALTAYLEALKLEPENRAALRAAASIYLQEKLPQKGVEMLEVLVKVAPADAQAHADLGAGYMATGNQEGAEQHYRDALRLNPDSATARLGLASIHLRNGDAGRAIEALRETVKLIPTAYEPHFLLGSAYNRQGRYQEAADELETALRLGSEDTEVYYHLARAYGGLGRTEDRGRALKKFTELTKKTKADTAVQLQALKLMEQAGSFVDAGDLPAAASRLEQARELRPADDALLFRLASVYYDLQKYAIARNYAEEAISLAPSKWLNHYLLGLIEIQNKSWQQARASLQIAAQLNPSAVEVQKALKEVR
ncbi:MAG: tetratricopeptide repeat protein [Acidobacteriota bacterium]|nr:tetratricopeptide repeat protein [Acidobacteriota bacterium]